MWPDVASYNSLESDVTILLFIHELISNRKCKKVHKHVFECHIFEIKPIDYVVVVIVVVVVFCLHSSGEVTSLVN